MDIKERVNSPTPKLFKKLRNIGLIMAAVGGTILTAPVSLPALITSIGGYIAVAGGVLSSVSQITVKDAKQKEKSDEE
ncbi:hypothetical protein [Psychroflexus halocasei]|uniref:Uncharacterized protein n=1 Tax=Psychroflexus halocasei TaxID=908615 RepID=A0A1H4C1R0_9FLAO|nr:hypothetical protein [Psychroflexus halocasei]SEA54022.1 hypothetical protein SAMN05421540_1072 [Psychroflexus halocasei]